MQEELQHLHRTLALVNASWEKASQNMTERALALEMAREEMLERVTYDMGGLYSKQGFEEMSELSQAMQPLQEAAAAHQFDERAMKALLLMRDSPYFARIDFCFAGETEAEKIYIGRGTLMDKESLEIAVYDWRAPVASVYYRYGVGEAEYDAPNGKIQGRLNLKRQYEIKRGELKYFFDADVQVQDAFLRELLSKNASLQMKSIVETIQRDQDMVIRDMQSDLMMVQGAAGSGKTSVALHRIAYLMYQGLVEKKLYSSQILILSPNAVFERYISRVLPELGEKQVKTVLFDEVFQEILPDSAFEARGAWAEKWLDNTANKKLRAFKGSEKYVLLLERFIAELSLSILPFCDVVYGGTTIAKGEELRQSILHSKKNSPLAYKLKWLENEVMEKARALKPRRMAALREEAFRQLEDYTDIKAVIRMLAIGEARETIETLRRFTKIDCEREYRALYENKALFLRMGEGLLSDMELEDIRVQTNTDVWAYEDAAALCYIAERVNGYGLYGDIRQVVLDEAQDTDEMHIALLKLLFPRARFTVLGDVHQSISGIENKTVYDSFKRILNKETALLVNLNKSFRCTKQIWAFASQFLKKGEEGECFSRDGEKPELLAFAGDEEIAKTVQTYLVDGLNSVALIAKTQVHAKEIFERLKNKIPLQLLDGEHLEDIKGAFVLPLYVAKGLEFDGVIVMDADAAHYALPEDKGLLYIAATRALHRLCVVSSNAITDLVEVQHGI